MSYVEGHEAWWHEIFKAAERRGDDFVTVTPEHGPPNYQVGSVLFYLLAFGSHSFMLRFVIPALETRLQMSGQ